MASVPLHIDSSSSHFFLFNSFFSLHLLFFSSPPFSLLLPHSPLWLFLHLDFHPRYILQPAHSRLGLSHLRDRIFVFVLSLSLYLYSSQLYPAISALKIGISAPRWPYDWLPLACSNRYRSTLPAIREFSSCPDPRTVWSATAMWQRQIHKFTNTQIHKYKVLI